MAPGCGLCLCFLGFEQVRAVTLHAAASSKAFPLLISSLPGSSPLAHTVVSAGFEAESSMGLTKRHEWMLLKVAETFSDSIGDQDGLVNAFFTR